MLLEKEFRAIYFDKLRDICLFEADFNWLQKLIFSKQMDSSAHVKGIIPPEQCATGGVDQSQGTMLKVYHNDMHRTMQFLQQLSAPTSPLAMMQYNMRSHALL